MLRALGSGEEDEPQEQDDSEGDAGVDGQAGDDANGGVPVVEGVAPPGQEKPNGQPDDLTLISGVGPRIQTILKAYQEQPPESFAGRQVTTIKDFSAGEHKDADGKPIPPEKFFFLELEGGYSFAVRASGTEPKIKFYVFGSEPVGGATELAEVKAKTVASVEELLKAILADAGKKAGE